MRLGMSSRTAAALALALFLLGACSFGPYTGDRLATIQPPQSAFLTALSREYTTLGDMERDEYDWPDTSRFYLRAIDAKSGNRVDPEPLEARDLTEADIKLLGPARLRLMEALGQGARALTPDAAARAQAGFDCWMQEQEEGHQPDDIAACRKQFDTAMAEVEKGLVGAVIVLLADADGKVGAVDLSNDKGTVSLDTLRASAVVPGAGQAPGSAGTLDTRDVQDIFGRALGAEPPAPVAVRLYFETGTDQLTPASKAELPKVLDLIRKRAAPGVEIAGHTDRVGSADANARLALQRAELVAKLVLELGVPRRLIRIDSFGERDPVVPTADGVDEPRNRRVEITVR